MRNRALPRAIIRPLLAGGLYFAIVFAAGFLFGTVRVLAVEPLLGRLMAVAIETPVILAVSWIVSGILIRRLAIAPGLAARLVMGVSAFVLLLTAELGFSVLAFGLSATEFAAGLMEPAGLLGLAAQLVFAAMPALRLMAAD